MPRLNNQKLTVQYLPPQGAGGREEAGSACLELDDYAQVISYEEYHPFGTTSYRSGNSEAEVSLKRFKYVGKERDEETGFYYYGARYYTSWTGRFVSVDSLQDSFLMLTPYQYASNKPITMIDIDGQEAGTPYTQQIPMTVADATNSYNSYNNREYKNL